MFKKYTEAEMKVSLLTLTDEKAEIMIPFFEDLNKKYQISTQIEKNKAVAEFHGITVLDLINSPNFEKLSEIWGDYVLDLYKIKMIENGMSEIQALAVLYFGMKGTI